MGLLIKGQSKVTLGFGEEMMHCPYCGTDSYADVYVFSTYYHIWFVPIAPMTKEINTVCQYCEGKRFGLIYKKELFKYPEEVKNKYRHRIYTYTGLILLGMIGALVLLSTVGSLLKRD